MTRKGEKEAARGLAGSSAAPARPRASRDGDSALVLLPPSDLASVAAVQELRSQRDKAIDRWPAAHLRIFWPFLSPRVVEERLSEVAAVLATVDPFDVTLDAFRPLAGEAESATVADSVSVGLEPSASSANKLSRLRKALLGVFPECDDSEAGAADAAAPRRCDFHLPVARLPQAEAEQSCIDWMAEGGPLAAVLPLRWRCDSLVLLGREGADDAYSERRRLPLGKAALTMVGGSLPGSRAGSRASTPPKKEEAEEAATVAKEGLRTSEDVYNRLVHDPDLHSPDDPEIIVGYTDRFLGPLETSFHKFRPIGKGGDLPWHRVYYFRRGDQVLWDREQRLDTIFGSGDTAAIQAGRGSPEALAAAEKTRAAIAQALDTAEKIASGELKLPAAHTPFV